MLCVYEKICLNGPGGKSACWRCQDLHLLKLPKDKIAKARSKPTKAKKDEPSWKQLERDVARSLSRPLTGREYESRQNPGSGNVWFRPGDVLNGLLLPEVKERASIGNVRSFRFEKDWLDKVLEEARFARRIPMVAFRFKDDDAVYACLPFESLVELVLQLQHALEVAKNSPNS
jgi:hypothetical protein